MAHGGALGFADSLAVARALGTRLHEEARGTPLINCQVESDPVPFTDVPTSALLRRPCYPSDIDLTALALARSFGPAAVVAFARGRHRLPNGYGRPEVRDAVTTGICLGGPRVRGPVSPSRPARGPTGRRLTLPTAPRAGAAAA